MFDGLYFDRNKKLSKGIVDFYSYKFFYFKRVLDLGCGYGDFGGVLYRLGSDVTGVDARQEHLKIVSKKYTGIKTIQANLDVNWPFQNHKFDLILDLGLLCHLADYEKHLRSVCASTTHLVLETSVCDSEDPQKSLIIDEDKATYDLSYNGKGCRPSAAAIERVLRENGMNFKRMDNGKFNNGEHVYDWYPKNDNSNSPNKRRLWFAVKDNSPIQFANPTSEIACPPVIIGPSATQSYLMPLQNSGMPATLTPKLPMSPRMEAEAKSRAVALSSSYNWREPSPIRTQQSALSINEQVRKDSRESSVIEVDLFAADNISQMSMVISPNTHSSRMWYKKISPFLPNLKLSKNIINMPDFGKVDKIPDVIMCSLDNLQPYSRLWIDEWIGPALTEEHLQVIRKSNVIITPSLLNAQEIWKHIPHAGIIRGPKPWPILEVDAAEGNYFLYLEKSAYLTELLFEAWDISFGNLVVVGSSIKVPAFATYFSDTQSYTQLFKLIKGARAIIDLSDNIYYASGINKLANAINIPVITNNHIRLDYNTTYLNIDKKVSIYPTAETIKNGISKFLTKSQSKYQASGTYNQTIMEDIKRIVGC